MIGLVFLLLLFFFMLAEAHLVLLVLLVLLQENPGAVQSKQTIRPFGPVNNLEFNFLHVFCFYFESVLLLLMSLVLLKWTRLSVCSCPWLVCFPRLLIADIIVCFLTP